MKLIYENDTSDLQYDITEELNESSGKSEKKYRIKGKWTTIGERNRNGRIYPEHLWEREVAKYQDEIKNGTLNTLLEWEHPARVSVDPMEAVAKTEKLYIKEGFVWGEAVLLDNTKAQQLKSLIDAGVKLSVSSRGVGKVGANGIVEDFKLTTYDLVAMPSDYNATMNGMVESYQLNEGILESKEFDIDSHGNVIEICTKNKCTREKKEIVQEAVIESFKRIFEASEEKVKEEIKKEEPKEKESTSGSLPYAIRNLTIKNLKYIISRITGSDKYMKASDLIYLLSQQHNSEENLEASIIADLFHQVQAKKYLKGEEK